MLPQIMQWFSRKFGFITKREKSFPWEKIVYAFQKIFEAFFYLKNVFVANV